MNGWMTIPLIYALQVSYVFSQSITTPGGAVAGRNFTLECRITRASSDCPTGCLPVTWTHIDGQNISLIYYTRNCTSSIPLSPQSPAGLSGGCYEDNGEEVYTVRIQNVTEDLGWIRWRCQYGFGRIVNVSLDVKVMVTKVTVQNLPSTLLAGNSTTFTCVTSPSKPRACIRGYIRSSGNVRELGSGYCDQDSTSAQTTTGTTTGTTTWITSRTLRFTASAEENGVVLYCTANNSVTDPPVRSQNHTLNVQYSPTITCNRSQVTVFEGQRWKISCDVTSKPEATIVWIKDSKEVGAEFISNIRHQDGRNLITSSLMFKSTGKGSSGVYHIQATNSIGSRRNEISVHLMDGQYIPKEILIQSCTSNTAVLFWASGINNSLVEYYNLEYKGTQDAWKEQLVRNPGRVKLVKTTVTGLSSRVLYQFRLQPNSDITLSEYATASCTVEESEEYNRDKQTLDEGLSKGGMFGVGLVTGLLIVILVIVCVTYWLLRRGSLTWNGNVVTRDIRARSQREADQRRDREPPPMGHYEDLDSRLNSGPQYEALSGTVSPPSSTRVYENTTVI